MAGKVFVNYRRDDDPSGAARVRDGLAGKFGRANFFMDVDNLLAGQRFDEELAKALAACDVLVAIIGPRWPELMRSRAAGGERDYVREEIAGALLSKLVVIPVRVGREGQMAPLPRADDLPDDIRDLVLYQKHDVAHERFSRDIADLIEAIVLVRRTKRPQLASRRPWTLLASAFAAVAVAGYAAAYYSGAPVPWPWSPLVQQGPSAAEMAAEKARVAAEDRQRAAAAKIEKERQARTKAETENKRLADLAEKAQCELEARQKAEAETKRKADEAERQRVAAAKAEEEAARRTPPPGQSFRDCTDGCPEMVVVPAGSFTMGSPSNEAGRDSDEGPQHSVTVRQPFAVGKFEVTFAEWEACVSGGGCTGNRSPSNQGWGKGRRPAINVSWNDAKEYVTWLSRKTGKIYRLLSEAEWEYAARAGTQSAYHWGDKFDGTKANNGSQTVPVGQYAANAFSLHDMHGNIWEWVEDCWHNNYNGAPSDGSAWTTACTDGSRRVVRGGSWISGPRDLRAANRFGDSSNYRLDILGFRVGRTF